MYNICFCMLSSFFSRSPTCYSVQSPPFFFFQLSPQYYPALYQHFPAKKVARRWLRRCQDGDTATISLLSATASSSHDTPGRIFAAGALCTEVCSSPCFWKFWYWTKKSENGDDGYGYDDLIWGGWWEAEGESEELSVDAGGDWGNNIGVLERSQDAKVVSLG